MTEKSSLARAELETCVQKYSEDLMNALSNVPVSDICAACEIIVDTLERDKNVFIAGNGGSASTAQHMASDLLSSWEACGNRGIIISLGDNQARWSATVNDEGPEQAFSNQLRSMAREGDLLVMISVSAASPNLVRAARVSQEMGLRTLALGGRRGPVTEMAEVSIEVGDGDYGIAEDLHLWFNHCLTRYLKGGPQRYQRAPTAPVSEV